MPSSPVQEIVSYLDHDDHSLAVRRLLDLSIDTGKPVLVRKAIALSRLFQTKYDPVEFDTTSRRLLDEMAKEEIGGPSPHPLLSAFDVSKTYRVGSFRLHPVSVNISTGDILGVVGENGNGKTTLLRCLSGQLAIDMGEIHYQHSSVSSYYDIKRTVAFIPQRIPRWYGLLKDNLHFSASIAGVKAEQNELMVDFMLERLGLSNYRNHTWTQISSGFRTRFEIARVLLQRPSLLILDEPLANLDIKAQQTILTDLKFMAKSVNHPMGVILSSQQLHEVEKIADNVLFIKQGATIMQKKETKEAASAYVVELETSADRNELSAILSDHGVNIHFNGGFYTLTSHQLPVQEILAKLVSNRINIVYFRDITYSTKRYFN